MQSDVIYRAQVFPLRLNKAQRQYMARAAGCSRFAYNWALAEWKRQAKEWWDSGKITPYPSAFSLQKQFNAIKDEQFPWVRGVSSRTTERAIFAVGAGFDAFRSGTSRYPRFKSRYSARSFEAATSIEDIRVSEHHVALPRTGRLRLQTTPRWPGAKACLASIRERGGRWYAAIVFKLPAVSRKARVPFAGVDLGIKTPIVAVAGDTALLYGSNLAERLKVERRKLRRANKTMHRRAKGSHRRDRARKRVAKIHCRMANVRSDFQHRATHEIASTASRVGVETLAVRNMMRNGRLARSVADVGFFEIKRQLKYKADEVVEADRWFPSSKTCSACGCVRDTLALADRTFRCEACGFTCDRDINAARNLETMAANWVVPARGVGSSAPKRRLRLSSLTAKREAARGGTLKALGDTL